jgi:hypothetical protein
MNTTNETRISHYLAKSLYNSGKILNTLEKGVSVKEIVTFIKEDPHFNQGTWSELAVCELLGLTQGSEMCGMDAYKGKVPYEIKSETNKKAGEGKMSKLNGNIRFRNMCEEKQQRLLKANPMVAMCGRERMTGMMVYVVTFPLNDSEIPRCLEEKNFDGIAFRHWKDSRIKVHYLSKQLVTPEVVSKPLLEKLLDLKGKLRYA